MNEKMNFSFYKDPENPAILLLLEHNVSNSHFWIFPLNSLQNMPNVRDHDASVYLRLQGDALSVGGYEHNPIFWDEVSLKIGWIMNSFISGCLSESPDATSVLFDVKSNTSVMKLNKV